MNPLLSILTPAIPARIVQYAKLISELQTQIGNLPVEHLVLIDNKRRTVGEKRDALLRAARGEYVAFVDDDDWIAPDYVRELLKAMTGNHDVITFRQFATVNLENAEIEFKLGNPNEAFKGQPTSTTYDFNGGELTVPLVRRNAWHVCAWRRALAISSSFPASNYGEDWAYAAKLCALPGLREVHIPKVLHFYRHSAETTAAPPP